MSLEKIKVSYKKGTNKINDALDKAFRLSGNKTGFQKFKASMISIVLGLAIAGIFILATGNNFLTTYWLMIKGAFQQGNWKILLVVMGAFVLIGLSVAFSFRTGLFNIGGSGQMLLGGGTAIYVMLKLHSLSSGTILLAFVIAIIIGFIWAMFAGFLKAYFNIHEVVSTILLNWIAFYIIQQMFRPGSEFYSGVGGPSSIGLASIGESFPSFVVEYAWLISIISISLVIFIIWFILSKTVFGYNLKVVGESVDVAKYAGVNTRMKIMISLGISGAIAGLGGGILYILKTQQITSMGTLPTYGFDGIVIALLAFNSPVGILASGLFYGILTQGQQIIQIEQHLGNETYQIIIGIIIYFAAISSIFFKFNPISWLKKYIVLKRITLFKASKNYTRGLINIQRKLYRIEAKKHKIKVHKNSNVLKHLKIEFKIQKKSIKREYRKTNRHNTDVIIAYEKNMKSLRNNYNSEIAQFGYYMKADAKSFKKSEIKSIKSVYRVSVNSIYEKYLSYKDSIVENKSLIRKRQYQLFALNICKNENKRKRIQNSLVDITDVIDVDELSKGIKEKIGSLTFEGYMKGIE